MKLLALVLVLTCVAACSAGKKKGQWDGPITRHRFRREADPQGSVIATVQGDEPQVSLDAIYKNLFNDGRTSVDLNGGVNLAPGSSKPQTHGQLDITHQLGENGLIGAHVEPDASGNLALNGEFRFKREAKRRRVPHIHLEAEKKFGKNGFVNGYVDIQQRPGSRKIDRNLGLSAGFRFRREAEKIGEIEAQQ